MAVDILVDIKRVEDIESLVLFEGFWDRLVPEDGDKMNGANHAVEMASRPLHD